MRKILILGMGCNDSFFQKEETMIRTESYAKHILAGKYPSVDFWSYTASADEKVHINRKKHELSVPSGDGLRDTFEKTRLAFQALDVAGIEYDYIFRTNFSTWVNVPYLVKFVESIPSEDDDKIFSSMIQAVYNGSGPDVYSYYAVGNSLLIPRRWVKVVIDADIESLRKYDRTSGISDTESPNSIYTIDDNAIGFICNVWAEQHNIDPHSIWKNYKKCGSFDAKMVYEHFHLDYISVPFRIYNDDRIHEFFYGKVMQEVADDFETIFDESEAEVYRKATKHQTVTFVRFGKTEEENEFVTAEKKTADVFAGKMKDFDYHPMKFFTFMKTKLVKV